MSGRFRYRREQRLVGNDIAKVLSSRRRFKNSMFVVQLRANGLVLARLGLIVPKRFLHSSVSRNLAKRHVREWFRMRQSKLVGHDILVRFVGPMSRTEDLLHNLNLIDLLNDNPT